MADEKGKATLAKLEGGRGVEPKLTVRFNPKELTFSKSNTWNPKKTPKENTPELEFGGGAAASLKLQLYFDTYTEGTDVRKKYLNLLYKWVRVDPKLVEKKTDKGRPPEVRFDWGGQLIFDGVISSLNERFTLFLPDATPVRAVIDLTLTESRDGAFFPKEKKVVQKQNPTSGGVGGDRVWVVREGDTLPWIAYSEYHDATEWRLIADANRLTQVRRLEPGTVLVIPNA